MKILKQNRVKTFVNVAVISTFMMQGLTYAQDNHHDNHVIVVDTIKKVAKAPTSTDGFKFNFKEDGSTWAKLNFTAQMWLMDNQNNPGSTVNGVGTANSFQVALRRARITLQSQVTDKVFIFGQFASDGITSTTNSINPLRFLDLTVDYKLVGKWLALGGGLSGWDGLSRFSNPSVPTILGLDMPLYQQATVNITDNTVRMPSVYAKGKIGKLDYRVALSIPYPTTTSTVVVQTQTLTTANANPQWNASTFAGNKLQPQVQGYFMYQFLDQESNLTPAPIGCYLGQKRVFNIGAGFRYQQNAMWQGDYTQGTNSTGTQILTIKDTARTAMFLWNIDLFYDAPINKDKGTALTIYAAYSNYNFGNNYIRNANPLNPATGAFANNGNFNPNLNSFSGSGNQFPMIGSGSIYFAQAGYLLPRFKNGTQFQPYGMFMYANYQAIADPVILWDLGVNYLIKGHNSKLSLDYQSRPIFNLSTADNQIHEVKSARRGMIVLQYQIAF
ncbi:MAG: hypothetical protein ACYDCN_10020 [Bacteroidia bacterium]